MQNYPPVRLQHRHACSQCDVGKDKSSGPYYRSSSPGWIPGLATGRMATGLVEIAAKLAEAMRLTQDGQSTTWICDDVKDCFDHIPCQRLLQVLGKKLPDEVVLVIDSDR